VASEKYIEQGLMLAAIDACLEVIRLNPDYLPIHLRLGEIYEREDHPEEALAKYQLLIETYMVRNEPRSAIDVYRRLIELSPDTINARLRLAELLKNDGRVVEAAEQLAVVASTYFRMGQTNKALEEYRRGLQWAPNSATLWPGAAQAGALRGGPGRVPARARAQPGRPARRRADEPNARPHGRSAGRCLAVAGNAAGAAQGAAAASKRGADRVSRGAAVRR